MRNWMAVVISLLAFTRPAGATASLGHYGVAPGDVAVSGVSSGAFMAVQLHVAYSATFTRGAAIFAGGPFYCAQGSLTTAELDCMLASTAPSASAAEATTDAYASASDADPTANLSGAQVWMWSGTQDTTVKQAVMDVLQSYYLHYGAAVTYENSTASGHGWISPDGTVACGSSQSPYLNNCSVDAEQAFLGQFFGPLQARSGALSGAVIPFDQNEFFDDGSASSHSLDATGYLYVPASCAAGSACHLVVALHGCGQSYGQVGDAFVSGSGLNAWADTNGLLVLYPQATTSSALSNPNACWDWWGYTGADYAKKGGAQMLAVKRMVDRISSPGSGSSSSSSSSSSSGSSSSSSSSSGSSSSSSGSASTAGSSSATSTSGGTSSGSGSTSSGASASSSSTSGGSTASATASSAGSSGGQVGGASSGGCGSAGGGLAPLALLGLRRRRRASGYGT